MFIINNGEILKMPFDFSSLSSTLVKDGTFFSFNWDSLHAGLNSHCQAFSYGKKNKKMKSIQEIYLERIYS